MKINITSFKNQYDNCAENLYETTWGELVNSFSEHLIVENKTDVPMFVYGKFDGVEYDVDEIGNIYTKRCAENFKGLEVLCLDYDEQFTLKEAIERFVDYTFIIYTSFSHKTKGKNFEEAFRVLIPLNKPMPVDDMRRRKKAIFKWAGPVDTSTLDVSRGFYIPSCSEENKRKAKVLVNDGKLLDWEHFEREEVPVYEVEKSENSDEKKRLIIDELKNIFIGHEPTWVKVCWAMKSGGFTFNDFCEVTIGRLMREKDVRDCEKKWNSTGKPNINMGFLVNLIRENGNPDFLKRLDKSQKREYVVNKTLAKIRTLKNS